MTTGNLEPSKYSDMLARVREQLFLFKASRQKKMLRVEEIIGIAASSLLLLLALFSYFYFYSPSLTEYEEAQLERNKLQKSLREAQSSDTNMSEQESVTHIRESMTKFETDNLPVRSEGRITVIETLNDLIRQNGLRVATGISFAPLDALSTEEGQPQQKRNLANEKLLSVYPGVGVNLTVEGSYPRLRKFVTDLEQSKHFVVIDAIELEGVSGAARAPGESAGETTVSLRLTLAAYFRRDNQTSSQVLQEVS
jgi:Tfp pilus assembly protein PilO